MMSCGRALLAGHTSWPPAVLRLAVALTYPNFGDHKALPIVSVDMRYWVS